jgi:predicted nucleic acid-binding protein
VAFVYFDASALVKLIIDEPGSDVAAALLEGCDAALSSRLAYPEVRGAIASWARRSGPSAAERRSAEATWDELWSQMRTIELTPAVERAAGELAARRALAGADAVHLASALVVDPADVVVAVWDRRLHAGAVAEGLAVAPATLDA